MNVLPNNGHHEMRYAGLRSNYHEFLCDVCGRHVLMHGNPSIVEEDVRTFVVLKQGDFWASHSGGTGGLVVNGVEIKQDSASYPSIDAKHDADEDEAELSDEWKAWLADIFDDTE